ncbi:MAG: ATP-binding cassette subfamily F protein 3 [Polyangiales bacterium]|jgi:ATP-binding cassette subfamily F protein 3
MSLVVLENLSLSFGGKVIVDDLSLRIAKGDRIGLIGPNGSGKTTIMRLASGEQLPDGGTIRTQKEARVAYLPQDVAVDGGRTLLQLIVESVPGRTALEARLERTEAELDARSADVDAPDYIEVVTELGGLVGELHEQLIDFDRLYSEHEAKAILAGLGFKTSDHDRDVGEFSGGWKMRAVLASLLFQRPDLLLMDEPTNHLDMPSVAWLSGFLKRYNRAFILISHDREFLNEQIDRVVSFEPEGVRMYKGNLDRYQAQRSEERILLQNRARNVAKERDRLERFVTRFKAKASKAGQARSKLKQLEKLDNVELLGEQASISFRFPETVRAGKTILEVNDLKKNYDETQVLQGVDLRVERGQRIALLGVNGAGKTTLLRILAGEIEATEGGYEFGHKTKVGYYAQHHAETLDRKATIYESVSRVGGDNIGHQRVRSICGALLFGEDEVDKSVSVLSGGERARVALAQLLIDPGNVLLMDEPTNHLDLDSSERLADALSTYDGTLLFVSHNRSFIRKLANAIWFVEDGKVSHYPGSLDDYMAKCRLEGEAPASATNSASIEGRVERTAPGDVAGKSKKKKKKEKDAAPEAKAKAKATLKKKGRNKGNDKKLRPLEGRSGDLEKRIAKIEGEQAKRTEELSDPAVYADAKRQADLQGEYERAQVELEVAMETWAEVQEELEGLQG